MDVAAIVKSSRDAVSQSDTSNLGKAIVKGVQLVDVFPQDDDPPNCFPFTPFLGQEPRPVHPTSDSGGLATRRADNTITHALMYFDRFLGDAQ